MSVDFAYVDYVQQRTLKFLTREHIHPASFEVSPLLDILKHLNIDDVIGALGPLGDNLRKFAILVDDSHPDFATQIELLNGSDSTQKILQLLDAFIYAKKQKWNFILPLYKKMARQVFSSLLKLRSPKENCQLVRLVKERKLRNEIRSLKKMRAVQLNSFYKKSSIWNLLPDNFNLFIPGSVEYENRVKIAHKKAKHFAKIGCNFMSQASLESIAVFLNDFKEKCYYGFYHISMINAVIILAKIHGYSHMSKCGLKSSFSFPNYFDAFFVFENSEEMLIKELESMIWSICDKKAIKRKLIKNRSVEPTNQLTYAPSAYPLHAFISMIYGIQEHDIRPSLKQYQSTDLWDLIQYVEAFPAFDNKAMFDHYTVVVPSVQPVSWVDGPYSFLCDKEKMEFSDYESAKCALDTMLVQKRLVAPILLGERDGKCYFISFWE